MGKKEISAKELNWKKVDVSNALDDFNGFYGLEEIDGVDVKVINGQAHFFAKDGGEVDLTKDGQEEESEKKEEDNEEEGDLDDDDVEDIDEGYGEDDLIEFKNFDDIKEGELSAASSSDDEDFGEEGDASESEYESANDELTTNVFNTNIDLDDIEINLPEWTKVAPNLSMTILQGLSRLEFTKPTEIQAQTIPLALSGEDIMGKASTGSGKTLAYGIPILETLIKSFHKKDLSSCIGLIFTPTRELAQQVTKHLQNISEKILTGNNKYAILSLTGGLSIQKQERLLKYKGSGRIVIATPGRFLELLEKNSKLIDRFSEIKTLVLDEADRLLQDGHFDEFEKILKLLNQRRQQLNGKKSYWQTMIFSATFSIDLFNKLSSHHTKTINGKDGENELEIVLKHLMNKVHFKSKPKIIDTNPEDKVSSQIKESLIECAPMERDLYVYYFLMMYPGQTLIFCNAIDSVKKLNSFLNCLKISSFQIHSSMTQKNRLKNLERYEKQSHHNNVIGKPTVLIASDVAARGLDIPGIQHVIHYHLPRTADVYIHRSGRTARGNKEGVSVMICSPQESMGPLRKLRKLLSNDGGKNKKFLKGKKWQKTVPLMPIDIDVVSQLKERCQLASELANHDIASTSLHKDDNWLKKAADDLGIDVDSDDENKDTYLAKNKTKKINKTMGKDDVKYVKAQLNELLNEPIRKDKRKKYLTGGLVNLADNMVKKRGHDSIIGHEKIDALELLKSGKKRKNSNNKKQRK